MVAGLTADLTGKQALVTGASRGLGRTIAIALAANGARVTALARDGAALDQLAAEHRGIAPLAGDVTDDAFVAQLAERDIDILVNNAGSNRPMPMTDVPADVLDMLLGLNVRSAYLVAQAAVRSMLRRRAGGSIINMTSQMGHVGSPGRTVYCLTKHALEGLTKAMAVELAAQGIRVNSIAPTFVETAMTARQLADPDFSAFVQRMIPVGRVASPDDVAAGVLYLSSRAARMVTGTSLLIDGGWTAQ